MKKLLKEAPKSFLLLILSTILIYFLKPNLYEVLTKEDSIIEYLTALLLLIMSILFLIRVINMRVIKGRLWIAFNLTVSLGLFFGFGEEISWGQRIFNITPGDFFLENNLQKELNFHNLLISNIKINRMIFTYLFSVIFGLYFYFSLIAYLKVKIIKGYVDNLDVPIPRVKHIVTFTLCSFLIFTIPDSSKWELWECLFAVILLSIFIDPYNMSAGLIPTTHKVNLKSAFPPPIPEKF